MTPAQYAASTPGMGHATTLTRIRYGTKPNPYNPDREIPDPSKSDKLEFQGFISTVSSATTPDAARQETVTTATLTVPDPAVDITVGDRVREPSGRIWQVDGIPTADANPWTGWRPTLEANLTEWKG